IKIIDWKVKPIRPMHVMYEILFICSTVNAALKIKDTKKSTLSNKTTETIDDIPITANKHNSIYFEKSSLDLIYAFVNVGIKTILIHVTVIIRGSSISFIE
ncbi:hypothetical protein M8687_27035, partial [Escherichia coli]